MTSKIDWSQYEEPFDNTGSNKWAQYEEPSNEQPDEYSSVPYAGPIARGALSGFLGTPGNLMKIGKDATNYVMDSLFGTTPEKQEKRKKFESEVYNLPTTQDIESFIDSLTQGGAKPKSTGERYAGRTAEFIGGAATPLGPLSKTGITGVKTLVPSAREAGASIGGGLASQTAEEMDLSPGIQLVSTILGSLAGGKGAGFVKNPAKELANTKFIAPKSSPQIKEVIKAADELGISLPYSSITESSSQKLAEKMLRMNPFSKESYKEMFSKANSKYVENYTKVLDRLSTKTFADKLEAGTIAQESLKESQTVHAKMYKDAYKELDWFASRSKKIFHRPGLQKISKELIDKLDKSIIPSVEESSTKAAFMKARENLERFKSEGGISLENLLATERSLNDIINYETQGGSQQLLKALKVKLTESLDSYAKSDRIFGDLWHNAKGRFGDHANMYRNDLINGMLFSQKPEMILAKMSSLSELEKIGKALSGSPNGEQTFKALKRFKLEEFIGKEIMNAGTGEVQYGRAAKVLNDPTKAPLIKELVGPENYKILKNLQKTSEGISKGFKEYANPSGTADVSAAIGSYGLAYGSLITGLATMSPAAVSIGVGAIATPKLMAKALTNEKFLSYARQAAYSGKTNNKRTYVKAFMGMSDEVQKMLDETNEAFKPQQKK